MREVADPVAALAAVDGHAALAIVREGRPALLAEGGAGVDSALAQDHLLGPVLGLDRAAVAHTDRIAYRHRADEAIALATATASRSCCARRPSRRWRRRRCSRGRCPQKSTYFYPKTVDGLVFYGLDDCI